jgi:hypothetical protein
MIRNLLKRAEYLKQWKVKNPEKVQAYAAKHRAKPEYREYQRRWAKEHSDKIRCYGRRQRENHYETRRALEQQASRVARLRHPLRVLLSTAKTRAKRRGLVFDLKETDFLYLPLFCPVFGIRLRYHNHKQAPDSASIDRINSDLGYVRGNVQIISWRANQLKSDGTAQEHFLISQKGFGGN